EPGAILEPHHRHLTASLRPHLDVWKERLGVLRPWQRCADLTVAIRWLRGQSLLSEAFCQMVQEQDLEELTDAPGADCPDPPAASFREPSGVLFSSNGRVLRFVNEKGVADLTFFLRSKLGQRLMSQRSVVHTAELDRAQVQELCSSPRVRDAFRVSGCAMAVE